MADAVLGQIFDWIYGKLAGFFSEFFEMMNMMGAELVMEVQSQVMDQFNDSRMGDTVEVLCDGWDGQSMSYVGRSYAESPGIDGNIYFTSDQPVEAGEFVRVRITGAMDGELTGERTEE